MGTLGIENLRAGLTAGVNLVVDGIKVAKSGVKLFQSAKPMVDEARDLDLAEGGSLIVEIVTVHAPRVIEAIRS